MSLALRALMNTSALEGDRFLRTLEDLAVLAAPANFGELTLQTGASERCEIDATNWIPDPQGFGELALWGGTGGVLRPADDLAMPFGWRRAMQLVGDGGDPGTIASPSTMGLVPAGTVYAYLIVRCTDGPVRVFARGISSGDDFGLAQGTATGWTLVRIEFELPAEESLALIVETVGDLSNGGTLAATGATLAAGADPGEPFSGETPGSHNHVYRWESAAHASRSVRHNDRFDLLALYEEQARLDVAPLGQTIAQRAKYLLQRWQARHHPHGETFVRLIAELIQTDDSSFSERAVRVNVDWEDMSFTVEIDYDPDAVMAARVSRLIDDIQPCHLRFGRTTYGAFRADINRAGDPV